MKLEGNNIVSNCAWCVQGNVVHGTWDAHTYPRGRLNGGVVISGQT